MENSTTTRGGRAVGKGEETEGGRREELKKRKMEVWLFSEKRERGKRKMRRGGDVCGVAGTKWASTAALTGKKGKKEKGGGGCV